MKNANRKKIFLLIAIIICGYLTIFGLSKFLETAQTILPESYADEDLTLQGACLKGYSLGFEGLIADWYWMKSLQYVGDKILKSNQPISLDNLKPLNPRLLYPYLDNATTLDPHFIEAYSYGAIVLPAIDQTQAVKIAEKGIAENPNQWRLYHQLGYIYWTLKNYEKAAEVYEQGAKIQNAPDWMKLMSVRMKAEGGSRETARAVYRQMFEQAGDEQIKETAALRLLQLNSFDEQDIIRQGLQNFQEQNNRCADNWKELFPFLRLQKLPDGKNLRFAPATLAPLDPTDVPYFLNRESGRCDVNINFVESKIPAR